MFTGSASVYVYRMCWCLMLQGVPVRIELGPRDVQKEEFVAVRRDTGEKITLKLSDAAAQINQLLENIHNSMFNKCVNFDWYIDCYRYTISSG